MTTAILDGRRVEVLPGDTILDAAARLGLAIPTLCHQPGLPPQGGCRVCLVELSGAARPVAACHTPLAPGAEVRTTTASLERLRAEIIALQGPSAGPAADGPLDATHPYLRFRRDACVTCRRCVEVCESVQGEFVYGVEGRGGAARLVFGSGERFADSPCVACGSCVDACPTGALTDRDRLDGEAAGRVTETVCGYCGVGCRLEVESGGGRVLRVRGAPGAAVNRGHLCVKGRYAHAWQRSPERLTEPLLRRDGRLRPVSWPEAVDWLALRLAQVRDAHGPDALGALASSRSTNEACYLLQKLFRTVIGTNNVDCCARVCHSSSAAALRIATGAGAATACFDDIERARAIAVVGANPTEAHPVVGARIRQAALGGTPLLVIDPRRTGLAEIASVHLQPRPAANVPLLNALARLLLERDAVDRPYLDARVDGLGALGAHLAAGSTEVDAALAGVSEGRLAEAADLLAGGPALVVHGIGLSEQTQGVDAVLALANLALLTGGVGRPGAGLLTLRGQNNVQGSADMGAMPDAITGDQRVDDPAVRARAEQLWGAPLPEAPGLTVTEMTAGAREGRLRALWIQGEDIAQSDPGEDDVLAALDALELVVVQELFLTETARRAHLVLPAAGFLEQDGTFTNAERRIQRVRAAVAPPGGARPDWEVVRDVARAMGADWRLEAPADVMAEIAALAPARFGGVGYERLGPDGLQWPCPHPGHPGTPRLHADGFPGGRARLSAVGHQPSPEDDVPGYPYALVTGRVLDHYNVGTMTRRTPSLDLAPRDMLEISPRDAGSEGLADGARVRVESRWGATVVCARVTDRVAPGTLFLSFHHPETHANRLVGPHVDPVSKCPQYKATAVRIAAADGAVS